MSIKTLMNTVESRLQENARRDQGKAESMITNHSDQNFRQWFPSLFDGEYPVTKWVMTEPTDDRRRADAS